MSSFAATISEWALQEKERQRLIFQESAQRLVEIMQRPDKAGGRMHVDTGYLRASIRASTSAMPAINPNGKPPTNAGPNSIPYDAGPIELVINGADIGDTLFIGYTANYARHREYGAHGQEPDAFVRGAAAQWQAIVADVDREAQATAAAR